MGPDRIVVGEVRGAEAFELSPAVFLCTTHADSAGEARVGGERRDRDDLRLGRR
jgi:Flp pilus assembly CpaF family ATPase